MFMFCIVVCPFSFVHCVVCPLIYRFWLPLWYQESVYNKWNISIRILTSIKWSDDTRLSDFMVLISSITFSLSVSDLSTVVFIIVINVSPMYLKNKPHKWTNLSSNTSLELYTCCKHFPVLSSFMTYHWVCNQINMTGATCGAGTAYPSGVPEFTPGFQRGSCYLIFSFMCIFWRSLFVLLYFFFWSLCCLFFFDLRNLITPLVSSNSSYNQTCPLPSW
jgi:hypothetical protein